MLQDWNGMVRWDFLSQLATPTHHAPHIEHPGDVGVMVNLYNKSHEAELKREE